MLSFFKEEILDNIIILSGDNKIAYLNKLIFKLEKEGEHAFTNKVEIDKWLIKYKLSMEDVIKGSNQKNELILFITSKNITFEETYEKGYNQDKELIQTDFYNYFYGEVVNEALDFINQQYNLSGQQKNKLRTNLSVPQLALLFKELNKLKPNIFDIKTNTELYQFISDSFTTKQSAGDISTKSIKNKFEDPNQTTIDFWADKFRKMLSNVRN